MAAILPKIKPSQVARDRPAVYMGGPETAEEENRADAQRLMDATKSPLARNRMGQFSTPFPIASQMTVKALAALPESASIAFMEPALGTGVFFSALLRHASSSRIAVADGCEIDPDYGNIAHAIWSGNGLTVRHCDFTEFASDSDNVGKYSLVCTNPPYVRHQHLTPPVKQHLQKQVMERLGMTVSGLSGLYIYFILLADALLQDGAIATWLLPAECLYVNYGHALRDYLTSHVSLISIHHFDPDEVQFDDALVSSCIVTYRKTKPTPGGTCTMTYGGSLMEPRERRTLALQDLRHMRKWTVSHFEPKSEHSESPSLKDLFTVRRGIATGANEFFIIDVDTIREFDIPDTFLRPILPSPRHIKDPVIEASPEGIPLVPHARFLLDCPLPPDQVKSAYPGLWRYLQTGMDKDIHKRYLCAQKEVWYYQEKRKPAPYLASYMGRANGSRQCPIRFFVNRSGAIATNVFLNLYPLRRLARCLEGNPTRLLELGEALNGIPAADVLHAGRAYGGGLHKIAPKELLSVRLTNAPEWIATLVDRELALI